METLKAKVEKIYPVTARATKDGSQFKTQKVLISFDNDNEYPSKMVLEQGGDKKIELVQELQEGREYEFYLNFRANTWLDPKTNMETAFGSISAWRADKIETTEDKVASGEYPF